MSQQPLAKGKLSELRTLMRETITPAQDSATPAPCGPSGPLVMDYNITMLPLQQSPRARAEREIHRIASWYGWQGEVQKALDRHGATYMSDLGEDQVLALQARMQQLLDCAMIDGDPSEVSAAR